MIIQRQCAVVSLVTLLVLVVTANVYFMYVIVDDSSPYIAATNNVLVGSSERSGGSSTARRRSVQKVASSHRNATLVAARQIESRLTSMPLQYHTVSAQYKHLLHQLLEYLNTSVHVDTALWTTASQWVSTREIVPAWAPELGSVLHTLCSTRILHAENALHGTQLKLMLTLVGNQKAIFKPQWYPRTEVIDGAVYAGKDRHNAEVAAFHLSLVLGLRRCPLTVGRKVNLRREVMPVASDNLLDTFYQEGNNTCFYGVCYYCTPQDPVCANKDIMEGALIMWLPPGRKLRKFRNPWQRTYKPGVFARWEMDEQYCDKVKATKLYRPDLGPRLLDLVDAAVFDFLISNGDRHHYEVFDNSSHSTVLLLDNGKSFGNPHQDHVDILAPLYQCCMLRASTWQRLRQFSGGVLGSTLAALLRHSHIAPVLTDDHLQALDRRLLTTFAAVEHCFSRHGRSSVLIS